jgi:hypothetical protein
MDADVHTPSMGVTPGMLSITSQFQRFYSPRIGTDEGTNVGQPIYGIEVKYFRTGTVH